MIKQIFLIFFQLFIERNLFHEAGGWKKTSIKMLTVSNGYI